MLDKKLEDAGNLLKNSKHTAAFTGAGISVESGIPPFRGEEGIWNKYDPRYLELSYFMQNPANSWQVISEIFYEFSEKARFNDAHLVLAEWEKSGIVNCVITQNIDNLHQEAGSKTVHEFHGNMKSFVCVRCDEKFQFEDIDLKILPPVCRHCKGLIKPDFIFFGEGIPAGAYNDSLEAAYKADVFIVIGTTGEVMPAAQIPVVAKQNGAAIIEVNKEKSKFTDSITDIFLEGKATEIMNKLAKVIDQDSTI